jgi:hypothetical protein
VTAEITGAGPLGKPITSAAFAGPENRTGFANVPMDNSELEQARLRASIGAIAAKSGIAINTKHAGVSAPVTYVQKQCVYFCRGNDGKEA